MATMTAKNRKKAEKLIYDTLMKLEPSGLNAKKYKDLFSKMSDAQFVAYFKKIRDDDGNSHLYVENDLYGENQISLKSIESAADHLNLPLEEYYYIQHKTADGTPLRSDEKVPVMYIHLKRMQQLLSKKVRTNVDIDSGNVRSRITGGLNSSNRTGRFTDADTQALISITSETGVDVGRSIDLPPIVTELLHARGDNAQMRAALLQQISHGGEASLQRMGEIIYNKPNATAPTGQASQTLDVYYIGAGLFTNLINRTYLTKAGAKAKA